MVLWAWAVTNPEGAFSPGRWDLSRKYPSSPESLGFWALGRDRDSKDVLALQSRTAVPFSRAPR